MNEPLLEPKRKSSFFFSPAQFYFREHEGNLANGSSTPQILWDSPSSIKEKLIFGSPELLARSRFTFLDGGRPSDNKNIVASEQLASDSRRRLRRTLSHGNDEVDSLNLSEKEARSYDDSYVDYEFSRHSIDAYKGDRSRRATSRLNNETNKACQLEDRHSTEEQCCIVDSMDEAVTENSVRQQPMKLLRRSRTAPAMTAMNENRLGALNLERPPLESATSIVTQAFIGLLLYLSAGVLIYVWKKNEFSGSSTHGFIDALYFCIVTMCTIGYGDITPTTPSAKLLSCAFVLTGFGFIDILLSGMVTYVLDRQETLLLGAVAGGHHEIAEQYVVDVKKGRMRIRMKVALAFGVVILCVGVGTIVMHSLENLAWLDAFYLSCMSVTTVGYGDRAFKTLQGRLFASIWLLVSTLAVARSFLYLAEAHIDKRHRLIAKWVLQKEMTIGDLVAADLDNDGSVSNSDYVIYKLKQMGRIDENEVMEVCRQFNRLDTENSGRITLSYLMNLHEASSSKM